MKFSIVIPARNEAANITKTILALREQTIGRSEYEIIVTDSNSSDNTAEVALKAGADILVRKNIAGTNVARQAGLERARGEIVVFLDADSLPPKDWLEKIEADLSDKKIAAVSGPYDYGFTGLKKSLAFFYFGIMTQVPGWLKFLFHRKSGIIVGGNFAARRSALEAIGGLPPLAFWGDDTAIAMLISRRVGPVLFDPKLIVKSSPRRFEKTGFFALTIKYMIVYFKIFFDKKYS